MNSSEFDYQDLSIWNINSIIEYTKENVIQIFLLILVFIIIYVVDHISNLNAVIFAMPSPIPGLQNTAPISQTKNLKRIKSSKKY
jgi:hypothetical protein